MNSYTDMEIIKIIKSNSGSNGISQDDLMQLLDVTDSSAFNRRMSRLVVKKLVSKKSVMVHGSSVRYYSLGSEAANERFFFKRENIRWIITTGIAIAAVVLSIISLCR